jgi:hypothetical protein
MISGVTMFPATLLTNTWPMLWSKFVLYRHTRVGTRHKSGEWFVFFGRALPQDREILVVRTPPSGDKAPVSRH